MLAVGRAMRRTEADVDARAANGGSLAEVFVVDDIDVLTLRAGTA